MTIRHLAALGLGAWALGIIITGTATSARFHEPIRLGWFTLAVVLAVVAFGLVVIPEVSPVAGMVGPGADRVRVVALWQAREALCALRQVQFDRWVLVSIRHMERLETHPLRVGTTGVAVYDPDVHEVVGVVVGGAVFPVKPFSLPVGVTVPRPLHYLDVSDTRKLRALTRGIV